MRELLSAQEQLQSDADAVVRSLGVMEELAKIGMPTRVGSSALGLMVRRDIDITVSCGRLDDAALAAFAQLGARLMQRVDDVVAVRFRNDSGGWNLESAKYPDGLYLGLSVRAADGADWTFDIWLVDQPDRQPDLAHLRTLRPRLTDEDRLVILEIKHVLAAGDPVEAKIPSALVYEAVMDHGVRTYDAFKRWHSSRQG